MGWKIGTWNAQHRIFTIAAAHFPATDSVRPDPVCLKPLVFMQLYFWCFLSGIHMRWLMLALKFISGKRAQREIMLHHSAEVQTFPQHYEVWSCIIKGELCKILQLCRNHNTWLVPGRMEAFCLLLQVLVKFGQVHAWFLCRFSGGVVVFSSGVRMCPNNH